MAKTISQRHYNRQDLIGASFFPLQPGMTWTYKITYASGSAAVLTSHTEQSMSGVGPVSVVWTYSDDRVLKKDKSVAIADTNFRSEEYYTPDSGFFTRVEELSAGSSSIRFEEPTDT